MSDGPHRVRGLASWCHSNVFHFESQDQAPQRSQSFMELWNCKWIKTRTHIKRYGKIRCNINSLTSSCCSARFEPLRVAVHPFSPAKALSASPDWMQAQQAGDSAVALQVIITQMVLFWKVVARYLTVNQMCIQIINNAWPTTEQPTDS